MTVEVHRVHAFSDNYLWVVTESDTDASFVVDPGDAEPVLRCLDSAGVPLTAILLTHHHPDHTGGVDRLVDRYQCPVYGPRSTHIPQVTRPLAEGDSFGLAGLVFDVIEVPGHTLDHIAYFCPDLNGAPALFCGDTLFAGGCGRLFEGNPAQMLGSLAKLAALPPATEVYCAHEYTLANLKFAVVVEPGNSALAERLAQVEAQRARDVATVPSTLAVELATNPFLRSGEAAVISAAAGRLGRAPRDADETFAAIRGWKDNF